MVKNNQKCVRIADDILKIVEGCKGEGFNEKFENMVIEFKKSIPEREKYLKSLNEQIGNKLKQLKDIEDRINGLKSIEFSLDSLRCDILRINNNAVSVKIVSQNNISCQASGNDIEIQKNNRKKCIS